MPKINFQFSEEIEDGVKVYYSADLVWSVLENKSGQKTLYKGKLIPGLSGDKHTKFYFPVSFVSRSWDTIDRYIEKKENL